MLTRWSLKKKKKKWEQKRKKRTQQQKSMLKQRSSQSGWEVPENNLFNNDALLYI